MNLLGIPNKFTHIVHTPEFAYSSPFQTCICMWTMQTCMGEWGGGGHMRMERSTVEGVACIWKSVHEGGEGIGCVYMERVECVACV